MTEYDWHMRPRPRVRG